MAVKDMPPARSFTPNPPQTDDPPICIGIGGPPGSGKTVSALRLAGGFARVRGRRPALIDSEAGRARKYQRGPRNPDGYDFDYFDFSPPFVPGHFLDAIKDAAKLNPSAIIVDNASDEHEGPGGVLEWHDRNVPNMGGNEWAAWNLPKASRRVLTAGIQQIRIPIILTFRARPKTTTKEGSKTPVKLGYVPVAGDELLGICDLMCLLPPKSNGVATWSSALAGEDFAIKIPYYLARYIEQGAPIDEDLGERLALWQAGKVDAAGNVIRVGNGEKTKRTPEQLTDAYVARVNAIESLDALRDFQTAEGTVKFVDGLRSTRPDLLDRIVEANTKRAATLAPPDDAELDGDYPERDDEDDLQFPDRLDDGGDQ